LGGIFFKTIFTTIATEIYLFALVVYNVFGIGFGHWDITNGVDVKFIFKFRGVNRGLFMTRNDFGFRRF